MQDWGVILELLNYLPVDQKWECQVCGKRYEHDEIGYGLIQKHVEENHQDAIKELKPELELRAIEQENREREERAEEDRLEAYRKAHHQCPCEKVIDGVKSAGWMTVLLSALAIAAARDTVIWAAKKVEKELKNGQP